MFVCLRVSDHMKRASLLVCAHDEMSRGRGPGEVGLIEVMNCDGFQLRAKTFSGCANGATSSTGNVPHGHRLLFFSVASH